MVKGAYGFLERIWPPTQHPCEDIFFRSADVKDCVGDLTATGEIVMDVNLPPGVRASCCQIGVGDEISYVFTVNSSNRPQATEIVKEKQGRHKRLPQHLQAADGNAVVGMSCENAEVAKSNKPSADELARRLEEVLQTAQAEGYKYNQVCPALDLVQGNAI